MSAEGESSTSLLDNSKLGQSNEQLDSAEKEDLPKDIELNQSVQEIDFHPFKDIIAAGTMEGVVKVYSYTADEDKSNHKLMSFKYHKEYCRAVKFSGRGDFLFTAATDKKIYAIDLNEGTLSRKMSHDELDAIYSLLPIDNYLLASGDDNGMVIIWDFRREMPLMTLKCCEGYVSKFAVSSDKRTLLASGGDGSLSVFNIRARKLEAQSELLHNDILSVAIVEDETKVVTALNSGTLKIFDWGEWSSPIDKFLCYNGSVDDIVSVGDNIICAACEDGGIRVIEINPNKIVGVLGNTDDLPLYNICVSHDKKYIASCAYEDSIKFHSLSILNNLKRSSKSLSKKNTPSLLSKTDSFFSGLN